MSGLSLPSLLFLVFFPSLRLLCGLHRLCVVSRTWPLTSISLPAALEPSSPLISAPVSHRLINPTWSPQYKNPGSPHRPHQIVYSSRNVLLCAFLQNINSCLLCFMVSSFGSAVLPPHPGWPLLSLCRYRPHLCSYFCLPCSACLIFRMKINQNLFEMFYTCLWFKSVLRVLVYCVSQQNEWLTHFHLNVPQC